MPLADTTKLRVAIALDKTSAELVIPANYAPEQLSPDSIAGALQTAGVLIDGSVTQVCEELAGRAAADSTREHRGVVAHARLPIHGLDGSIQWHLGQGASGDRASHYDRCAFIMVEQGQEIATIIEPTAAQDGCDVTGHLIAARPGTPAVIRFDDSIVMDSRGVLTARISGAVENTGDMLRVREALNIENYVDFSTGNIGFNGDVMIGKGVRDCFTVQAGGNIRCDGVIEAATITCKGDLVIRGMAGREHGIVHAGGNLTARYIDSITAEIGRDLCVERSVVNCKTVIHGAINSPHATVIGGRHVVTGPAKVHTLGSPANAPTELVVGTVPRLDPFLQRLSRVVSELEERLGELNRENSLVHAGPHPATRQSRRMKELNVEIARCEQSLVKGRAALAQLNDHIAQLRMVYVEISHVLHLGTVIIYAGQAFHIREDIKGSLVIERGDDGHLIIRSSGITRGPLNMIADIKAAA